MAVNGDLKNIKKDIIAQLDMLYDYAVPSGQIVTRELAEKMLELTALLGREVAVYISRQGKIMQVSVGDNATVELPEIRHLRNQAVWHQLCTYSSFQ